MKKKSGSIKVTWAKCPRKTCPSHNFPKWDVDFQNGDFWCGTCEVALHKPIFDCPVLIKRDEAIDD